MLGVTSVKGAAAAAWRFSTEAGGKVRWGRGKQSFSHAFLPGLLPKDPPMLEVGLPTSVKAVRTVLLLSSLFGGSNLCQIDIKTKHYNPSFVTWEINMSL